MQKSCDGCGSTRFNVSRFRLTDLPKLFAMQYPVRCVRCQQRWFAHLPWMLEHRRKRTKKA
jgi:hypothetical protein